jgi:hypothetical protein
MNVWWPMLWLPDAHEKKRPYVEEHCADGAFVRGQYPNKLRGLVRFPGDDSPDLGYRERGAEGGYLLWGDILGYVSNYDRESGLFVNS